MCTGQPWLAGAALLLSLAAGGVAPATAQSSAAPSATAEQLFDPAIVHDLRIAMHSGDWTRLREHYMADTYYPGDATWDGHVVRNVGIRSRGFGSRDYRKPALKVDFNRYVSGQSLAGLKGVALDNFRQDPAMLKEVVSLRFFARLGLPAPRAVHARVFVNGEYLGVFALIELVDTSFLRSRFGEDDGYLYDFEWDWEYRFTWLGDDPRQYAGMFRAETHEEQPAEQVFGPLIAMITAVNRTSRSEWPSMLARYFDVDALMAYVAAEAFLADHDGLAGDWGINNFYLYRNPDGTRVRFIPWDKDVNFREPDRDVHAGMDGNPLLATLLNYPHLRDAYHAAVRRSAAVASAVSPGTGNGWLELEIAREAAMIREAMRQDVNKSFGEARFEQEVAWMLAFAQQRSGQVLRQVGGR